MDCDMDKKGKRCPNFSKTEEQLVLQLVSKYAKQVECKRSDTDTNKIKKQAWETIAKEFNSLGNGQFRDPVALRKKYENFKKTTKRKHAIEKMSFYKTGGGPSCSQSATLITTDEDNLISSIISTQVEGFTSEFDGDVIDEVMSNTQEIVIDEEPVSNLNKRIQSPILITVPPTIPEYCNQINEPNIITEAVVEENSSESDNNSKALKTINIENQTLKTKTNMLPSGWGKYTPEMLKNPKHEALKSGPKGNKAAVGNCRKTDLKTKLGQWAATKQLFVNTQEECFKREHELTMAHKKQKHEQEMRHAEELQQERLRQMRVEHELKILEMKGNK